MRAKYEPTPAVVKEVDDLVRLQAAMFAAEERFKAKLAKAAELHKELTERRIPISYLAERLDRERKGIYRLLGRRMS